MLIRRLRTFVPMVAVMAVIAASLLSVDPASAYVEEYSLNWGQTPNTGSYSGSGGTYVGLGWDWTPSTTVAATYLKTKYYSAPPATPSLRIFNSRPSGSAYNSPVREIPFTLTANQFGAVEYVAHFDPAFTFTGGNTYFLAFHVPSTWTSFMMASSGTDQVGPMWFICNNSSAGCNGGPNTGAPSERPEYPIFEIFSGAAGPPPTVTGVSTTPGGTLTANKVLTDLVTQMQINFSATDVIGADNSATYKLVRAKGDGVISTTSCSTTHADDTIATINTRSYSNGTLTLGFSRGLAPDKYRLLVCGSGDVPIRDDIGQPLDGDGNGTPGGNYTINFDVRGDFGDLPAGYDPLANITVGQYAGSHLVGSVYLGASVNVDTNGTNNANADADTGDDGVSVSGTWANGANGGAVDVTVTGGNGCVSGWIDFNGNSDLLGTNDPGDHVIDMAAQSPGTTTYTFDIPANTITTGNETFFARFRVTQNLGSAGCDDDIAMQAYSFYGVGEVEDYLLGQATTKATINLAGNITQAEGNSGTTNFVFTVNASEAVTGTQTVSYTVTSSGTNPANAADFVGNALPSGTATINNGARNTTITIPVAGDTILEPHETFTVTINAASDGLETGSPSTAIGTINNDDSAAVTLNDPEITEGDTGTQTMTFNATLTGAVQGGLSVSFATANATATTADNDYVIKTGTLNFAGTNNEVESFTVIINGDARSENDETFNVNLSNVNKPGITISDVGIGTIRNDDIPDVVINEPASLTTTEAGGAITFDVVLSTEPYHPVTLTLSNVDASEGSADVTTLTFNPITWNTPQQITLTGVDDDVDDGDITYMVNLASESDDTDYNSYNTDFSIINTDNDTAAIVITPTSSLSTDETGTQTSFTVRLDSEPTADVMITLTSGDTTEGEIAPSELTFNNTNWGNTQTVTITGVNDFVVDGDITYTITGTSSALGEVNYDNIVVPTISVTNLDDDVPQAIPFNLYVTGDFINAPYPLTYHWTHQINEQAVTVPGEWYRVVVLFEGTKLVDKWFEASEICTGLVCAAPYVDKTNPAIQSNGTYSWWVEAYTDANNRTWSDEATFDINVPLPAEVVRTAPINNATVNAVQLQWEHQDGVAWYQLHVAGPDGYVHQQWYEVATTCSGAACALTMNLTTAGGYEWYVRANSSAGNGPWQGDAATFTVQSSTPGEIVRISPNSTTTVSVVNFIWDHDPAAVQYNLVVQNTATTTVTLNKWVAAVDICNATTCSLAVDTLTNVTYAWYVRGWSGSGMGPWQSSGMNFTLNAPLANPPVLTTPALNSTVAAGTVTVTWPDDPAASWYRIVIAAPDGTNTVFDQHYSTVNYCDGTTCTMTVTLSAGNYAIWTRAWGGALSSNWGTPRPFSVQ